MNSRLRVWLPVLAPMVLGLSTALIFLVINLRKNTAVVTIKNKSGYDLLGGQLGMTSLPKGQEVGEIKNGDSAVIGFEKFGAGQYVFTGQFRNGKAMHDSGGVLGRGRSYKDNMLILDRNDSMIAEFRQVVYK